jgi:hypothetical protein
MGTAEETKETKQSNLDYKDVENGPLTEANRECRDIFCCILFIVNIVWMCYATGVAYGTGNPTKIFRPISTSGEICGQPGNTAELFPYAYYSNPAYMLDNRYCVKSCPLGSDTSMLTSSGSVALNIQVDANGNPSSSTSSLSSSDDIAYYSTIAAERVCVPTTSTFTTAFASFTSTFASIQQGELGNFILDVKNVTFI